MTTFKPVSGLWHCGWRKAFNRNEECSMTLSQTNYEDIKIESKAKLTNPIKIYVYCPAKYFKKCLDWLEPHNFKKSDTPQKMHAKMMYRNVPVIIGKGP